MEKKVLIIAYHYLSSSNAGVQRIAKFVHYLPMFGYEPIVVTAGVKNQIENEKELIYRIKDQGLIWEESQNVMSILYRGIRRILFSIGILGGYKPLWYRSAVSRLPEIVEQNKPDMVFCTYPWTESLMLGVKISEKYKLPLVVDFRDGMAFEPPSNVGTRLTKWKIQKSEGQIIKKADYIIAVTDPLTDYFRNIYKIPFSASTITNGFDEDEFINVTPIKLSDKINFVYTGRLNLSSFDQSLECFIKAIQNLTINERDLIKVFLVGDFSAREKELVIKSDKDKTIYEFVDFLPRSVAIQYQISADILLLVTGKRKSVATGKLFEYLGSGNPIFALAKNNAAEKIINQTGAGVCVDPFNEEEIIAMLKKIVKSHPKYDFFHPIKGELTKFKRKHTAEQLANIFNKLLEERIKE